MRVEINANTLSELSIFLLIVVPACTGCLSDDNEILQITDKNLIKLMSNLSLGASSSLQLDTSHQTTSKYTTGNSNIHTV